MRLSKSRAQSLGIGLACLLISLLWLGQAQAFRGGGGFGGGVRSGGFGGYHGGEHFGGGERFGGGMGGFGGHGIGEDGGYQRHSEYRPQGGGEPGRYGGGGHPGGYPSGYHGGQPGGYPGRNYVNGGQGNTYINNEHGNFNRPNQPPGPAPGPQGPQFTPAGLNYAAAVAAENPMVVAPAPYYGIGAATAGMAIGTAAGMAIGAAAASAPQVIYSVPPSATLTTVNGVTYYVVGGNFYKPVLSSGGQVQYIQVPAP